MASRNIVRLKVAMLTFRLILQLLGCNACKPKLPMIIYIHTIAHAVRRFEKHAKWVTLERERAQRSGINQTQNGSSAAGNVSLIRLSAYLSKLVSSLHPYKFLYNPEIFRFQELFAVVYLNRHYFEGGPSDMSKRHEFSDWICVYRDSLRETSTKSAKNVPGRGLRFLSFIPGDMRQGNRIRKGLDVRESNSLGCFLRRIEAVSHRHSHAWGPWRRQHWFNEACHD